MDVIFTVGNEPFILQQLQPVICGLLKVKLFCDVNKQITGVMFLLSCICTEPVTTSAPVIVIGWKVLVVAVVYMRPEPHC